MMKSVVPATGLEGSSIIERAILSQRHQLRTLSPFLVWPPVWPEIAYAAL